MLNNKELHVMDGTTGANRIAVMGPAPPGQPFIPIKTTNRVAILDVSNHQISSNGLILVISFTSKLVSEEFILY